MAEASTDGRLARVGDVARGVVDADRSRCAAHMPYHVDMDPDTVEEIKRHFGVVAEDLRSDVQAVAEGQALLTERIDSRFDQVDSRFGQLETRVERGFQELQSMIRLSYTEIDRRFGDLESEVRDLRTRVERLEAPRA